MSARERIVNSSAVCRVESVEPHPLMLEKKDELRFDYGKFDFVFSEGRPVLLDANKTVGAPPPSNDRAVQESRGQRALAVFEFLTR